MAAQPVRTRVPLNAVKAGVDTKRRRIPLVKWQFMRNIILVGDVNKTN
jgi:hypothetical protein